MSRCEVGAFTRVSFILPNNGQLGSILNSLVTNKQNNVYFYFIV